MQYSDTECDTHKSVIRIFGKSSLVVRRHQISKLQKQIKIKKLNYKLCISLVYIV
jgi:hypothetical protein